MPTNIPYIATLEGVQEATLRGRADLDFWRERLLKQQLEPCESNGAAQIVIGAMRSRWMGMRFREFVITVTARPIGGDEAAEGFLLLAGFNSSSLLAFCERAFFSTPYQAAKIEAQLEPPSISVQFAGKILIEAAAGPLQIHDEAAESWEGPIFIPRTVSTYRSEVFYARLAGPTLIQPWSTSDRLQITATDKVPCLQDLLDSRFEPTA